MSKFKPVGVLTKSSTGKTLRLEIHSDHHESEEASEKRYYIYPDATQKVINGKKKSATIYAIEEDVPSLREIAEKIEALGLKCHWCREPIRASNVDHYPHDGGVLIKETFPKKAWVYFNCVKCGYQWALWKLLKQAEMSMFRLV